MLLVSKNLPQNLVVLFPKWFESCMQHYYSTHQWTSVEINIDFFMFIVIFEYENNGVMIDEWIQWYFLYEKFTWQQHLKSWKIHQSTFFKCAVFQHLGLSWLIKSKEKLNFVVSSACTHWSEDDIWNYITICTSFYSTYFEDF